MGWGPTLQQIPVRPILASVIATFFLGLTLFTVFQKGLVAIMTVHEWGRYEFAIPAAITKLKYGGGWFVAYDRIEMPLMEGGFTENERLLATLGVPFPENLHNGALLNKAMKNARDVEAAPPREDPHPGGYFQALRGSGADDAGLSTYVLLSITIFGYNIEGFTYLYFLISILSIVLFILGHGRHAPEMAALAAFTAALYALVGSDLIHPDRLDLKDPRFLSTLAGIPLLHLVLYLTRAREFVVRDYLGLLGQSVIFAFVVHVRSSAQWGLLALIVLWLLLVLNALWWNRIARRDILSLRTRYSVVIPGCMLAVFLSGFLLVKAAAHPLYRLEGDVLHHTLWHGLYYALQNHPEWESKYGNGASGDAMPVLAAKLAIQKLPAEERQQYLTRFGWPTRIALEKFSRLLFVDLLRHDPRFVADTFFIFKPFYLFATAKQFYASVFRNTPRWRAIILIAALAALGTIAAGDRRVLSIIGPLPVTAGLFALLAWIPNWLVTHGSMVMVDHFLWGLFAMFSVIVLIVATLARALVPRKVAPVS